MRIPLIPCLALLLVVAAGPASAAGTPPVFKITPDTVRADETGAWYANLSLDNKAEMGLYADSLSVAWRNDDPDSSAKPHVGAMELGGIVSAMPPAGVGESTGMMWNAPADFERGQLTFRLVSHDGAKNRYVSTASVVIAGNAFYDKYPATLIPQGKSTVEVVVMAPDSTVARPVAGLLYVPPPGATARSSMRWASHLVLMGMTVALVSQPGSGRTTGPADRSGPASVAAVDAALARLAREPGVDKARLALWGDDAGGTTALLAAQKHPELQGVIAVDAMYDPWAAYRAMAAGDQQHYVREAGRDSAAWRARSPLAAADKIAAPVLVLQTTEPGTPDAGAAEVFAHVRSDRQLYIESRIGAQEGRPFLRRDAQRVTLDFLKRRFGAAKGR